MSPPAPTTEDRTATNLARLWCLRCDDRGFVWRRLDGSEVLPDDPRGVIAARCRHPSTHRLESWVPDADRLDELSDAELEELEAMSMSSIEVDEGRGR